MTAWRLLAFVCLSLFACAPATQPAGHPAGQTTRQPVVYVALGASETLGIGTEDPSRESVPQQIFQHLDQSAVMYNFGLAGATTEVALRDELPGALRLRPTLATVWFNVNDLVAGVPVADYETRLDQMVGQLRAAGARVVVANTPHLDRLPAYFACRLNPPAGSPPCPLGTISLPPQDQLEAQVQAYNTAIDRVVQGQGARLVDLYGAGEVPDLHPEYVSSDGFHPSARGAAAIAAVFVAALG